MAIAYHRSLLKKKRWLEGCLLGIRVSLSGLRHGAGQRSEFQQPSLQPFRGLALTAPSTYHRSVSNRLQFEIILNWNSFPIWRRVGVKRNGAVIMCARICGHYRGNWVGLLWPGGSRLGRAYDNPPCRAAFFAMRGRRVGVKQKARRNESCYEILCRYRGIFGDSDGGRPGRMCPAAALSGRLLRYARVASWGQVAPWAVSRAFIIRERTRTSPAI